MKKILKTFGIMTILISMIFTGCTNTVEENKDVVKEINMEYVDDSYITSVDWLKENLNNDNLLIIDARGEKPYKGGHIPGAISVSWQQFSKMDEAPGNEDWGTVLDKDDLSKKLSQIGVNMDKEIVVYANTKAWGEDGRILWMLRMAGLDNSKLLDGGWNLWEEKGYETTKEEKAYEATDFKIEKLDESLVISTEELSSNMDNIKILDSRKKIEYDGAIKYGEKRGGHIKDATLLTFDDLLNGDGTFKNPTELDEIFKQAGLNQEDEIATYCTAGIRSAHLVIGLRMMGYENAKNYDASFYEWAAKSELPIE
ncbi:sulfurtransferase [Anaeromicrobium sediminis]|uniref:thiosulfate sulfurtransferase n=1 Tax=Anaeromicrobium sediminis TaxID=1478221 RepID=A0A267MGI4_9FIRM|nr:rhodanese-like domain-containing protein [Anaeromicrobium sediminis]PAB58577.1 sulfurtransferase [Anaeromicrobium sediminis]